MTKNNGGMMAFGEHLVELRRMLFRILAVMLVLGTAIFCFKEQTFNILFAPNSSDFITYRAIEEICRLIGMNVAFEPFTIQLINTELSSQFMTHLTTSVYLALLVSSPYILTELLRFVTPALYDNEKKYSTRICVTVFMLFLVI